MTSVVRAPAEALTEQFGLGVSSDQWDLLQASLQGAAAAAGDVSVLWLDSGEPTVVAPAEAASLHEALPDRLLSVGPSARHPDRAFYAYPLSRRELEICGAALCHRLDGMLSRPPVAPAFSWFEAGQPQREQAQAAARDMRKLGAAVAAIRTVLQS